MPSNVAAGSGITAEMAYGSVMAAVSVSAGYMMSAGMTFKMAAVTLANCVEHSNQNYVFTLTIIKLN